MGRYRDSDLDGIVPKMLCQYGRLKTEWLLHLHTQFFIPEDAEEGDYDADSRRKNHGVVDALHIEDGFQRNHRGQGYDEGCGCTDK